MRPRPRPALVLGFVIAMAAVFYSQNPPSPRPSRALKETAEHLKGYYRAAPIEAGWRISGITTDQGRVWVDVQVSPSAATLIAERKDQEMAARLRPVCPPASDVAWRILRAGQDIEVRAIDSHGRVFITVSCRAVQR